MELKQFVKSTINEIMDAIEEVILERKQAGRPGIINPKVFNEDEMEIDAISFDMAVTAGSKTEGGAEGTLQVWSAKVGGNARKSAENNTVSRVSFTLGVSWPYQNIEDAKKLTRRS